MEMEGDVNTRYNPAHDMDCPELDKEESGIVCHYCLFLINAIIIVGIMTCCLFQLFCCQSCFIPEINTFTNDTRFSLISISASTGTWYPLHSFVNTI